VEGEEGDHAPRHFVPPHPRLAQRPEGEHDPPRPGRREEQRRRQAGHVDLIRLQPGEAQDVAAHHRLEERDVGGEGDDVEADRDRDPKQIGVVELAQRVAQPDQLREEEVDADQQRDNHDRRLDQSPTREDR
jgi:hypothetical protein